MAIFLNILSHQNSKGGENIKKKRKKKSNILLASFWQWRIFLVGYYFHAIEYHVPALVLCKIISISIWRIAFANQLVLCGAVCLS